MKVESVYLTTEKNSILCGKAKDAKQKLNITAINKLQTVPWEINEQILHLISDELKPSDASLTPIEEKERVKSYTLRDKETSDVIDYLLENGNKFWFNWKFDSRGRQYSQGYHVNIQGNPYRKAMLRFSNKELLTKEGINYLKVDIANTLGYDKETWFGRLQEANKVINNVFSSTSDQDIEDAIVEYSKRASEPLLFIKAMYAWKEGVVEGKPIGHNVGLDCTASGIQIMAALSGCVTSAQNSNVHAKVVRTYTDEVAERLTQLEAELASL